MEFLVTSTEDNGIAPFVVEAASKVAVHDVVEATPEWDAKPYTYDILTLESIKEFKWTDDYSYHRALTCVKHPSSRIFTKNPHWRNIHVGFPYEECSDGFEHFRVIVEDSQPPRNP